MRQWKIAAALLAFLLLPTLARADDLTPEKIADIKKLFVVSQTEAELREVIDSAVARGPIIAAQQGVRLTPETQQITAKVMHDLYTEKLLGPGGVQEQMIPVIAETFTDEEIQQYIKFYETPLGKKIATATPAISKRQADILTTILLQAMREFPQRLVKALKDGGQLDQAPLRRTPPATTTPK